MTTQFLPFVPSEPVPQTVDDLYLDLLKRCLTRAICAPKVTRHTIAPRRFHFRATKWILDRLLSPFYLEIVQLRPSEVSDYLESTHEARNREEGAETMVGIRQLDQMQAAITDVIRRQVPGDVLEAGVWRGGMAIFMRGVLKARGDQRRVWVADSFEGLPDPGQQHNSFGWRKGDMAVSLEQVKSNFSRYGLLDEQVVFLSGFFHETLSTAAVTSLSVLRADADLYESTREILTHLYPKLSVGGYAIFDDYQNLKDCRRAIDEYRLEHQINDPIISIDKRAVYWIKSAPSS